MAPSYIDSPPDSPLSLASIQEWSERSDRRSKRRRRFRSHVMLQRRILGLAGAFVLLLLLVGVTSSMGDSNARTRQPGTVPSPGNLTGGDALGRGNRVSAAPQERKKARRKFRIVRVWPEFPYRDPIVQAAHRYDIDPALFLGLVKQESLGNPEALSPVGARGLAQLMPETARGLGLRVDLNADGTLVKGGVDERIDPAKNLDAGARYLRAQMDRFGEDIDLVLASYNAGPNRVAQTMSVPPYPETQHYAQVIKANMAEFREQSIPLKIPR